MTKEINQWNVKHTKHSQKKRIINHGGLSMWIIDAVVDHLINVSK